MSKREKFGGHIQYLSAWESEEVDTTLTWHPKKPVRHRFEEKIFQKYFQFGDWWISSYLQSSSLFSYIRVFSYKTHHKSEALLQFDNWQIVSLSWSLLDCYRKQLRWETWSLFTGFPNILLPDWQPSPQIIGSRCRTLSVLFQRALNCPCLPPVIILIPSLLRHRGVLFTLRPMRRLLLPHTVSCPSSKRYVYWTVG